MHAAIKDQAVLRCLLIASAIGLGAACHLALPFASSGQTGADGQARDLSDLAAPDSPRPDINKVDAPRGPDGPRRDGPPKDVAPPKDQASGEPTPPCAPGATVAYTYSPGPMAICKSTDATVWNQCAAETFCNKTGNWHLCKASEFKARGGQNMGPSGMMYAWVAGCSTRTGAAYGDVTDGICSCAGGTTPPDVDCAWACPPAPPNPVLSSAPMLGVHSYGLCQRVGQDTAINAAYWTPAGPTWASESAVCCK